MKNKLQGDESSARACTARAWGAAQPLDSAATLFKATGPAPYQPTTKERWEEFKPYLGPAIAGVLLVAVGGWAGWRLWRQTSDAGARATLPGAQLTADETGAGWRRVYADALVAGNDLKAAEGQLERWARVQRERINLNAASPAERAGLAALETALGHIRAKELTARSMMAEEAAARAQTAGDASRAAKAWQEALQLQMAANGAAVSTEHKDLQRETRLARIIETAVASPLRTEIAALRADGERALEARQWSRAMEAFAQARAKHLQIVETLPVLREALASLLHQLEIDGETAASGPLSDRIREREQGAARNVAAGEIEAGAAAYEQVAALHQQLVEQYPKSRYASAGRRDEFEARRHTALAGPAIRRAAALAHAADGHLRRQAFGAAVKAADEALALLDQIALSFPRSRDFDPHLRRRLEFLRLRQNDLAWIHAAVGAALAPLGRVNVFTTEVHQALYRRVMNINPGRTASPALPVDSVSWHDARQFCQRLSWLLGTTVRLPTDVEFHEMVGANGGTTWTAEVAHDHTHAPDAALLASKRIQNTVGNVAEWLDESAANAAAAPIGGGSFRDTAEKVAVGTLAVFEKKRRSPYVGFRFVVEGNRS